MKHLKGIIEKEINLIKWNDTRLNTTDKIRNIFFNQINEEKEVKKVIKLLTKIPSLMGIIFGNNSSNKQEEI